MPTRHDRSQSWKRIGWILSSTIGVIVSLLTFPNAIAWMIAGWLLCFVVLALRSRRGWLPLATCIAILLAKVIDACRAIGAEVILIEIPRGFIVDPYRGLERELARANDLELIPDSAIRNLVLWSPFAPPGMWLDSEHHLSDDGLHPNTRGNRFLANRVGDALVRLYGSHVRAR